MARARRLETVVFGLLVVALSCRSRPPQALDAASVGWNTYSNATVGYSLEYPEVYTVEERLDGAMTLLRHEGYPSVAIRYTDERGGRAHGLWQRHDPLGTIELGGRSGQRFVYNHHDGPFFMRTVSYVVSHRDRSLGLEFRTEGQEPDAVERRVKSSFRFDP